MLAPYTVPDFFEYDDASAFFKSFISLNSERRGFSQRSFSNKIGWPVSYLTDLIRKRRNLTIDRAVEFGNFLRLSPIDFEQLIYLALLSSNPYSESLKRLKSKKIDNVVQLESNNILQSGKSLLILATIVWLKEKAITSNILKVVQSREITQKKLEELLTCFLKEKFISYNGHYYEVLISPYQNFNRNSHDIIKMGKDFNEFERIFLEKPMPLSFINNSFLILDEKKFKEVHERAIAFHNWMTQLSVEDSKLSHNNNTRLYQFNFNLLTTAHYDIDLE